VTARPGRRPVAVLALGLALIAGGFGVGTLLRDDGDGPSREESATPSTGAPAPPGLPPGTIRLGVPEEPAGLDPFDRKSRTAAGGAVLGQVLPQLFRVDPGGRAVGWLADEASVKVAGDGSSASFSLRPDARWSDGTPITTGDLRFTLDTVRGEVWPGPRAGYDRLTAVEGEGTSATFRFDGPFPGWRRLFSGADFVLPAHRLAGRDLRKEWTAGPDLAGGPFRLGPVTPGLSVVLQRNDSWWGDKARAAAIQLLVVQDVRTMEQLLARGDLDAAWPPATSNRIGRFRALDGVEVSVAEPGGAVESLVANTANLPVERRRAYLGLANRDRFVDVLLAGEAVRAVTLRGPAVIPAAGNATWANAGLEPDGGRLQGAPLSTLLSPEENQLSPLLGRVLQSGAQAAGTTLELKSDDAPEVESLLLPEGRFDLALARTVAWPDPCWSCWFAEAAAGRGNVTRVTGLTSLAAAADRDAAAVVALETRVLADALLLPLWRPRAVLAGRGVGNLVANSWQLGPFWAAESWTPPGSR
jgi:ABC-type transport system substrate-binding protein